ncbi:MAG: carboxypeptidase-like regulatory domain-containing protein [Ignavibacteriales bacterium]|nr:carboxypeptidase-like regulatory domain-containing protein [Ignavibacteriales bacterium]
MSTFIFLIVLSVNLYSQTSGKLVGRVTDESGEPLIGANVILDGTTMGAATDLEGYYSIINVRAGTYNIRY